MSSLTQNERDGLEDVFFSIHTPSDKYRKIKYLSTLLMTPRTCFDLLKLLKQAKEGLKETKIIHFIFKFTKKKKNLSK
jgi:hypothetical protein